MFKSIINIVALSLILVVELISQTPVVKFDHLNIDDGLSQSTVYDLLKDRFGYMWFATEDGLNRYNGYDFEIFKHDIKDSTTISNNVTICVEEDSSDLWIGTIYGLNRYDPMRNKFYQYFDDPSDSTDLLGNDIRALYYDSHGRLWVGTMQGLNIYDRKNNKFRPVIKKEYITSIREDNKGKIWFTAYNGIFLVQNTNVLPNTVIEYTNKLGNQTIFRNHYFYNLLFKDNYIFIATNGGLYRYDFVKRNIKKYAESQNSDGPSNATVWKMMAGQDDEVWLATYGGLDIFNTSKETFIHYQQNRNNMFSLSDERIFSLYREANPAGDAIWIGTMNGGINILDYKKIKFEHFKHNPDNPNSIRDDYVTAIYKDTKGNLWIGTNDGLTQYYADHKRVSHYFHKQDNPKSLTHSSIFSLYEDSDGNIWVGTFGGLNKYNAKENNFTRFFHQSNNPLSLSNNFILCMYEDHQGTFWIGTKIGLNRYDKTKNWFYRYTNSNNTASISNNYINDIYMDNHNQLYIGTLDGLNMYHYKTDNFSRFPDLKNDSKGIGNHLVLSIFEDESGQLWVGTKEGLDCLSLDRQSIVHYDVKDGLCHNTINGILQDNNGMLWFNTYNGLSKFNPKTTKFTNFYKDDGLQSNEFMHAHYKDNEGKLYFGGINGYNTFFPGRISRNQKYPPIIFTSIKVMNQSVNPQNIKSGLKLSHNDTYFSFEFAALDYTNPLKNEYAYKMQGFDKDWIHSGQRRYAAYTHLNPGKYTFKVKASNSNGVWNEDGINLDVYIAPPFWQTWWFYLLSMIALGAAVALIFQIRVRQRVNRALEIERIKTRETELIRKKAAEDFHDGLGHKLAKISLLSQTLKTVNNQYSKDGNEYLDKIVETSETLNMDMRNFIWLLDPGKDSFFETAIRLKDFGEDLFDKTGITFRVKEIPGALKHINLDMDFKRNFILLFREAMNNALKHSSAQNVELRFESQNGHLNVMLKDDGRGFNINNNSNGNGLKNIKQRAKAIGSELEIRTELKIGTELLLKIKLPEYGAA